MPCRFASSGTVATSRSASRAILALNVASNFLRDLVISVLHPLRQSRTLHTLTFGPISGVHFRPRRKLSGRSTNATLRSQIFVVNPLGRGRRGPEPVPQNCSRSGRRDQPQMELVLVPFRSERTNSLHCRMIEGAVREENVMDKIASIFEPEPIELMKSTLDGAAPKAKQTSAMKVRLASPKAAIVN